MNIISTQYTLKYRSFEIVVSGCKGENGNHCKGCHSPETWDFNLGTDYNLWKKNIAEKVKDFNQLIDWFWVYGGEPLDQNINNLIDLLSYLNCLGVPIMLFTRYDYNYIPKQVLSLCNFIKTGKYDCELLQENYYQNAKNYQIKLASTNQKIIEVKHENN